MSRSWGELGTSDLNLESADQESAYRLRTRRRGRPSVWSPGPTDTGRRGRALGVAGHAVRRWDGIGPVVTIGTETPMTSLLPPGHTDLLTDWLKQPRVGSRARRRLEP